ncbi:adenosylcobinamide-GDP ribazoletransferase [uncultured Parasphingorhabdus sp.]|uniref:adenosylcobinamide-GDP ribazoletransferase n=1 Tax=uncultured Parasphingorhabdus sp. TaxID=2709694 RepID=UPI0030D939D8|tara:strand:+ start:9156 stop:9866 length:711 start_codon:yes stop_codon:yes gene_type:complete
MKRLILAVQFMTRLPLPNVDASAEDFAACIRWFPAAGLIVGGAVAGAAFTGGLLDPLAGALFGLVAWVAITGALHLDGLGDIADAAGAVHADRERLSAVLADPHIGSFGVTAIALQLITKLILLYLVVDQVPLWMLILLPAIARIGPLVWTLILPPLHAGLASRFREGTNWWQVAGWAVVSAWILPLAPGLGVAIVAVPLWACWLRTRIGGISGDGHGAGIELLESVLLCALVATA